MVKQFALKVMDSHIHFMSLVPKKARRNVVDLRKLLGRDTTPRGAKYKIYLPHRTGKSNCIVATPSQLGLGS